MAFKTTLTLSITAAVALLFTAIEPSNAKIILKEKVSYYSVSGKTGREIFKDMIEKGPRVGRNERNHALATTEYQYDIRNVDVEIKNGRCSPRSLDILVNVKYTYPRWSKRAGAKQTTKNAWSAFNKAVIWHEKQHVKIAMDYARDYEKVLLKTKLRANQNCEEATFVSKWRAVRAALKHNRRQRMFDRKDLKPGGRGYNAQLNLLKAE